MLVSDQGGLTEKVTDLGLIDTLLKANDHTLVEALGKVRSAIASDDRTWLDLLQLSAGEAKKVFAKEKSLPLQSLVHLCDQLSLDLQSLVLDQVDYRALSEHYLGNDFYLPESFELAATSRRRTLWNILKYLEVHYGWVWVDRVLKRFQLRLSVFSDLSQTISVGMIDKILQYLCSQGFSDRDLMGVGQYSVLAFHDTAFGQELLKVDNPKSAYEYMLDGVMYHVERNWHYETVSSVPSLFVCRSRSREELADAFKTTRYTSPATCLMRAGFISGLIGHLGLPMARVRETKCIHRGDSECRFEAEYPTNVSPLRPTFPRRMMA